MSVISKSKYSLYTFVWNRGGGRGSKSGRGRGEGNDGAGEEMEKGWREGRRRKGAKEERGK